MKINKAEFSNETLDIVKVNDTIFIPYPGNTQANKDLQEWLDSGNEISAYTKPTNKFITKLDVMDMIGFDNLVAIETASETDPSIKVVIKYLDNSNIINIKSDRFKSLINILVDKGLVSIDSFVDEINDEVL